MRKKQKNWLFKKKLVKKIFCWNLLQNALQCCIFILISPSKFFLSSNTCNFEQKRVFDENSKNKGKYNWSSKSIGFPFGQGLSWHVRVFFSPKGIYCCFWPKKIFFWTFCFFSKYIFQTFLCASELFWKPRRVLTPLKETPLMSRSQFNVLRYKTNFH